MIHNYTKSDMCISIHYIQTFFTTAGRVKDRKRIGTAVKKCAKEIFPRTILGTCVIGFTAVD